MTTIPHERLFQLYISGAISNAIDDLHDDGQNIASARLNQASDLMVEAITLMHESYCTYIGRQVEVDTEDEAYLHLVGLEDRSSPEFACREMIDDVIYGSRVIRPRDDDDDQPETLLRKNRELREKDVLALPMGKTALIVDVLPPSNRFLQFRIEVVTAGEAKRSFMRLEPGGKTLILNPKYKGDKR